MEVIQSGNLLELINSVITPEFTKLSGLEFNYDSNGVNYTLFYDYLGLSSSCIDTYSSFMSLAQDKLGIKKREFLNLKKDLEARGEEELGSAYAYYLENFRKIELFFHLLSLYIPVEAQKITVFEDVNITDLESSISEIEELEAQIFGEKLSDRPREARITLDYIREQYSENESSLSDDEKDFLEKVLGEVAQKIGSTGEIQNAGDTGREMLDLKDPLLGIEGLDQDILEKEISQEQYVKVFELAVSILGLEGFEVRLQENISNVSVSYDSINIPASHPDYESLTVERIIGLISHELERHAIGNVNNKAFIGNLKSLSYLGQEEGVAHIMEHLALGYDLDNMPINRYMSRMLVGELIDGGRFKRFLVIMNKLDNQNIDVEKFFKRFKRGKDFSLPGVNPKEKLYGIGAFEIINRLRAGENPLGFFLAKNGTGEQEQVTQMITGGTGEITPEVLHAKHAVLPLMLGELLRYQLLNPEHTDKGMLGGFLKYFNERYGELFDGFGINYRDFIKNHIGVQNKENRKRVREILEILEA